MKDFLGNELSVGSRVVLVEPGYRSLVEGEVTGITEKRVKIKIKRSYSFQQAETIVHPTYVVKVGGQ